MKKALLLLMITLLLFTAACSDRREGKSSTSEFSAVNSAGRNTYCTETDNPYYLSGAAASNKVVPTENGYYFLIYDTLLYADAETMEPIPVCSKPNCRHNEETDDEKRKECHAYFKVSSSSGNVFFSNGQLYVFHSAVGLNINDVQMSTQDYVLTRVSPDGVERTNLFSVKSPFPLMNMIHRGNFYFVTQTVDEQGVSITELWSYSLDDRNEEPQLLYQSQPLSQPSNIVTDLCAYGTRLYLREYIEVSDQGREQALRIYDLTSHEWTVLENPEGYNMVSSAIVDGKLLCTYTPFGSSAMFNVGDEVPDLSAPMLISELDGSSSQEIAFDAWGSMTADDSYIYMRSPRYTQQQADGSYTYSTPTDSYYFYDSEMNLVDELPLESLAREGDELLSCTIYPMHNEHILIHARYRKCMAFYYFERTEIGTGEITPVEFHRYGLYAYSFAD